MTKHATIASDIPLICEYNSEEDRTAEDDVVGRKENLRKQDGVEFTVVGKWPLKH